MYDRFEYTITLRPDDKIAHAKWGIDEPDGKIVVYNRVTSILVVKRPGSKYWSQLPPGPTHGYSPARFEVYKIRHIEEMGLLHKLKVKLCVEFPVRS